MKYKKAAPKNYLLYKTFSNILILTGILLIILAFGPIIKDEAWYQWSQLRNQKLILKVTGQDTGGEVADSVFARFLSTKPITIEPINKDFSIVIEKIGVNAPIVADVSVTDEVAYNEALKDGVAHAGVSNYPSAEPGNVYLFAHSSVNFWRLGGYANVFNLLRKVELGDRIHIFYDNKQFVYEVVNKETLDGWNTYPLNRPVLEPTLTLQTCDPPGTTFNRLVVTSKLIEVNEFQ